MRNEIRDFDQLSCFECVNPRSFPQGELEILSQRSEGTMGADWTPMLAGEKRETCSIYPYRGDGREADSTDERALSPISKKNRQDSTKTTHRIVIGDRLSQTTRIASCRERVSRGITVDWSCATSVPFARDPLQSPRLSASGSASKKSVVLANSSRGQPEPALTGISGLTEVVPPRLQGPTPHPVEIRRRPLSGCRPTTSTRMTRLGLANINNSLSVVWNSIQWLTAQTPRPSS